MKYGLCRLVLEHVLLCRMTRRILYDTLKLKGERNNTESCLNGYQSKSVQGWCLWEIWLVDGAAPSLNKHMAAFYVMFGTPILTATRKSKVTSKCFFHPFSSTLLILKMASTAMGTAFLVSLVCAVLYFMPQMLHFDLSWDESNYFFSTNKKSDEL